MQALKERLGFKTKADSDALTKPQDIEKAIKEAIEKIEGVTIEENTDRIKNFFNGKFLRGMRREVGLVERQVSSISQSQKEIIESLDTYMEKIRKKLEEKIDEAKSALFVSILEKNAELNTRISDLSISSNKLQKKIFGMRDELSTKGSILKLTVNDFIRQFENYRANMIKIKEDDLADNACERIVTRIQTQTDTCEAQIDQLIDTNLNISQIFTTSSPEVVHVSAMEMLDFDDTMSTMTDDLEVERRPASIASSQSQLASLKRITQMTLGKKIRNMACLEHLNLGIISFENSDELSVYDVQKWKETRKIKCSGIAGALIQYYAENHLLFVGLLEKNIDIFTVDSKGGTKLAQTIQTTKPANQFAYVDFINGLAVSFGDSLLQIWTAPNFKTSSDITVEGEQNIGALMPLSHLMLILCGSKKDGNVRYVDPKAKKTLKACPTSSKGISMLARTGDKDSILIGSLDGSVELVRPNNKGLETLLSIAMVSGEVSSLELLADDCLFVVTNKDEFVRFYNAKGKLVHKYKAFMEDGILLYLQKTKQFVCIDPDLGQLMVLQK